MKTYLKIILIVIWIILTIILVDLCFGWLTMANTVANIAGLLCLVIWALISYITKGLTKIIKK